MGERDKETLAEITVNSWGPKSVHIHWAALNAEAVRAGCEADFKGFHKPHTDS